ncbi:MAG: succinylglutamate desuccinylase/aspartoacylase family protein, partial [Desulfobacterales bacterium]|nr:succinylglutamate desuccinylase/aspartoacylase family protein [Desulfobacterales bacterium]
MKTKTIEKHTLPCSSPGHGRFINVIRYGDKTAGKKAYLQAGLHADEPPGFVVMHHLIDLLDKADRSDKIKGEILLTPVANPIGLSQWTEDGPRGRFDLFNGINFNRRHPDLLDETAEKIKDRLGRNADDNVALIRGAMSEILASSTPLDEAEYLKHLLLTLSHDADIVLDLHCDSQALLHVYMGAPLWPDAADLPAQLGADVTLLAKKSGGNPYDEACGGIWWELAEKFPDAPIPPACLASTVEFRGQADVSHETAARDARNLYYFLQRRGFIRGDAPELPALVNEATPLRGVEHVLAPRAGVVVFLKDIGEFIEKGEVIAEIINPLGAEKEDRVTEVK